MNPMASEHVNHRVSVYNLYYYRMRSRDRWGAPLTQAACAARAGLSQTHYGNLERGRGGGQRPDPETARQGPRGDHRARHHPPGGTRMTRGRTLDAHWLRQQAATNPDFAQRNAHVPEVQAALAVTRPRGQTTPSPSISPVEVDEANTLREQLKPLAKQYGWQVRETWTPSGPDRGWHLILLKPGRLIFATWRPQDYVADAQEVRWQDALATLDTVGRYQWTLSQFPQIAEILAT